MSSGGELSEHQTDDGTGPVEFAPRLTGRVVRAALRTAVVPLAVVAGLGSASPGWSVWLIPLVLLPGAVLSWLAVVGARSAPWALRVDASGVRWCPQGRVLGWSDIAAIEVHVAHGLRRLLPHVNQVLLVTIAQADFARRAGTKPMGHGIRLAHVRATPELWWPRSGRSPKRPQACADDESSCRPGPAQ